jgi:hypothetical protein
MPFARRKLNADVPRRAAVRRAPGKRAAVARAALEALESRRLLSAVMEIQTITPAAREGSPYRPAEFRISNSGSEGAYVTWTIVAGSAQIGTDLPEDPVTHAGAWETIWVPAGGEALAAPTIINDYYPEPTETFSLTLSAPEQGTEVIIGNGTAQTTIEDDDVNFTAVSKTVTGGDEIEWGVRATDYDGNPVANLAVYVENTQGPIATTLLHDLTDSDGYAELGLRGTGLGSGYITVRAYDDFRVDYRSPPTSFRNRSAAPRMNWIQSQLNSEDLIASFDGLVRIGLEVQKWDGSGPLRKAGLPIEWGMDHTGDYAERQADLAGGDWATDNLGRAYTYVDGNVVQRLFRDMDPTPTGTTTLWAKYPITSTFKKVNVRSKAPVIDLRVTNTTLHAGDLTGGGRSTFEAYVSTSQGLPVLGSRIVVTTLESDDLLLGFLFNSGGGGFGSNTVYSSYSNEDGIANFEAQIATFWPPGTQRTAQLVAQCAADTYYSWKNADVETLQIV